MRWDAWVALVGWCVFAPLYLRAAYREMLKNERSRRRESPPSGRRRAHDDENLTKP